MASFARRLEILVPEEGAFAVLFAICLVAFFAMIGLAVDLAAMRSDQRASQSVTDASATAGGAYLDPGLGGTPYKACAAAWSYFKINSPGVPADTSDPCIPFNTIVTCTAATTPITVEKKLGRYTVDITIPEPSDGNEMEGRSSGANIDGTACQRIGMTVATARNYLFASIVGISSGSSNAHAVARTGSAGTQGSNVALIVLDPTGCNALLAKGQGNVLVQSSGGLPGIIAVDSSGTKTSGANGTLCSGSSDYAIDATGTQNSSIMAQGSGSAPGTIYQYALTSGQGAAHAYDPSDVTGGRLSPQPLGNQPVTRAPVDYAYNCKASYTTGISACPAAGTTPAYIDNLRAAIGTTGLPSGYVQYNGPCKTQPGDPPVIMTGNVYVPCANFQISNAVSFDMGSVVFAGSVNLGSSTGVLTINGSATSDQTVYFRSGGNLVKDAQSSITMRRTMVYLDNGYFSLGAGTGAVTWIAPTGGDFKNLALWSESSAQHDLGGQAGINLEGVFFIPNATPFQFSGQGAQYQTKAQFFVYRMVVTGQGTLVMAPDPDRVILIPLSGVSLIR